jgi:hypothetical protein
MSVWPATQFQCGERDAKKDGWIVISMKDDWKKVFRVRMTNSPGNPTCGG